MLFAVLHGRTLGPAAKLRTRREGVRVNGRVGAVEVVIDDVAILDARRVVGRFRELEAEVVDGDAAVLGPVGKRLTKAGARPTGLDPKVFRVLGPVRETLSPPLEGDADLLRAALDGQVRELLRNDPGTRLGADPEALHDMRVAIRRLRAFLKLAAPALEPAWCDDLRERLRWLGIELGPARDFDVMAERLRAESHELGPDDARAMRRLLADVEARRAEARSAMVAALRSDPYLQLLADLERAAASPRIVGDVELERWAAKAYAKLRGRARAIEGRLPRRGSPRRAEGGEERRGTPPNWPSRSLASAPAASSARRSSSRPSSASTRTRQLPRRSCGRSPRAGRERQPL